MSETPYRIFNVRLAERRLLTPNMARLVFAGADLAAMTTLAPDQRIKLFFPREDGTPSALPVSPDYLKIYKALPPHQRAPMRTYTIRAIDPARQLLTVDFVVHGDNGPASRWAMSAEPGDPIQTTGPNSAYVGEIGGFDWEPPPGLTDLLIIGDETALPAIAGILEQIALWENKPRATVCVELPCMEDAQKVPSWDGLDLRWLPRDAGNHGYGELMVGAALAADIPGSAMRTAPAQPEAVDVDKDTLWDRAAPADNNFYGWIAGETAAVSRIRTHFLGELGIDRNQLTMMGYWRYGKAHA